jgi:hypothetical protein
LLEPPPESGGELVFGNGPHDPFPSALEALLGQVEASQLLLHLSEQEEVRWHKVRRIGGMRQYLDRSGGKLIFDKGGSVDGRIVPLQEPLLLDHHRPFVPEMLQELAQDYDGVVGVDGDTLGTMWV